MFRKIQPFWLLVIGAILGIFISLNFSARADRSTARSLPIDELRAFEVFGRIKNDYVETVDDKKLIKAINGMLSGLDPIPLTSMLMRSKS